ncbi:MAG: hypothetical protein ACK5KP_11100 [Paludibacteraceae bacterium]
MIDNILREELEQLKNEIIFRHEQAGQVASGKTRASFSIEVSGNRGELWGNAYVGVLETGRQPGKVPYQFRDIIKRWAIAKGLTFNDEKDLNRFAYFVAQKIAKEGTKLFRSGMKEDIFETPIRQFTERISERIYSAYSKEIENQIFA